MSKLRNPELPFIVQLFLYQFSARIPTDAAPKPPVCHHLHRDSKTLELFGSGEETPQSSPSAPGEEFACSWIHIPKMMFLQGVSGPRPLEIERVRREGGPEGVPSEAAAPWSRKKSIEVVRASDQDASRKACQGAVTAALVCQSLF